jgi:copper chaperone
METIVIKVDGMTCQGCVASVTRVLQADDGVSDAQVSLEGSEARVTFDSRKTSQTKLTAAIEEAGYEVIN